VETDLVLDVSIAPEGVRSVVRACVRSFGVETVRADVYKAGFEEDGDSGGAEEGGEDCRGGGKGCMDA